MLNFPKSGEYAPYVQTYLAHLAPNLEIFPFLDESLHETLDFARTWSEDLANQPYAPGKWTYKQTLLHLLDSERILGYRALRFARGDASPLPGFDEDAYAQANSGLNRPLASVLAEYQHLRQSHLWMFRSFEAEPELWLRSGSANGHPFTVRALLYMIAGHEVHHRQVLKRYFAAL